MSNHKSPGINGIPVDFYKVFYLKLKNAIFELFNYVIKTGHFFTTAWLGIISLIPKGNRDTRWVKNYRPIVLLCADYKLFSKLVANRIKPELQNLIHKDQSGFIANRNIADNTRKVTDMVRYADKKMLNTLLIQIDFEKAFDRVENELLYKLCATLTLGKMR